MKRHIEMEKIYILADEILKTAEGLKIKIYMLNTFLNSPELRTDVDVINELLDEIKNLVSIKLYSMLSDEDLSEFISTPH